MKYVSNSTKETAKIAKEFADKVFSIKGNKGAIVVGLSGELGAGKTTLTKSFAKALGIKEKVSSPTFVILKKYKTKNKFLIHIDAYRINKAKEILDLGWKEITRDPKNIILVEWAENIRKVFPKSYFWLNLVHIDRSSRGVDIKHVR